MVTNLMVTNLMVTNLMVTNLNFARFYDFVLPGRRQPNLQRDHLTSSRLISQTQSAAWLK
jgi:hypothetical protein